MPSQRLIQYLDQRSVKYLCLEHPEAFTAQEVAHSAHVSGKTFTKSIIVNVDGRMVMAVIHAKDQLDLERFRKALGANEVRLAKEEEFGDAFSDCEIGAIPPFGNLYGMEVFLEEDVPCDSDIVFSAGTHKEAAALSFRDFEALVEPITVQMKQA